VYPSSANTSICGIKLNEICFVKFFDSIALFSSASLVSHSEAVNLELEKEFTIDQIKECLEKMEGCKVIDERQDGGYSTPLEAAGKDETFISRIREDKTKKNCLNMWIVSDNLLRGAALNAVEIAETLIENNFYGK